MLRLQQARPFLARPEEQRHFEADAPHLAAPEAELPQLHAFKGMAPAGTNMAASHTRSFAVMVLQKAIGDPRLCP